MHTLWLKRLIAPLAAACVLTLVGCASTTPPEGITAVTPFEVARYQGHWFEAARLDHSFERGMTDVSATYTPQPDGSVRVLNRGFDPAKGGWREAEGRAVFIGAPTTGSLKVSFFGPFYGGYHVAALDADYRWSIVVGPDRSYAWVLTRDQRISPTLQQDLTRRIKALGIAPEALIWVSHDRQDPKL